MQAVDTKPGALGVLTSGGDAPGMNAAVRAVVRAGLAGGFTVYGIHEGFLGLVEGGERIRAMDWMDVGGVMQRGGTIIGSARCEAFRQRDGRLRAARHLLHHGIDRLVVIGGDGSLTGAARLQEEWPELLAELVRAGELDAVRAQAHGRLHVVGLVGSIDNDLAGIDMTIGADTALHRILEALDAITSTAASHQRTFVVEVMGRHCGYLGLMAALATDADWLFIPEHPPAAEDWAEPLCEALRAARAGGRRHSLVVVAEGARDALGNPIRGEQVRRVLEERLRLDVRLTILGHVQRGGAPSAFDRWMSTLLGAAAVEALQAPGPEAGPCLVGVRENRILRLPLAACIRDTAQAAQCLAAGRYEAVQRMRGGSFVEALETYKTLARACPHPPPPARRQCRFAVLNAGAPAPGMNTATRVAVRLLLDAGHQVLGVRGGLRGLVSAAFEPLGWMDVEGWVSRGGSELGTGNTLRLGEVELAAVADNLQAAGVEGLLIIGGWTGYEAACALQAARARHPALALPVVCLPAAIDNDLPGSEHAVGADTALNNIVAAVDKIKQSAVAAGRAFVVEVMGGDSGYLALMSGLAAGAEQVYLPEDPPTLADLQADVARLVQGFERGKRVGLLIRNERAGGDYDTRFMRTVFEREGGGAFEVREAILGHLQQGGDPSPFDRIQATLLAKHAVERLIEQAEAGGAATLGVGLVDGRLSCRDLAALPELREPGARRPRRQWWLSLREVAEVMARPGAPGEDAR